MRNSREDQDGLAAARQPAKGSEVRDSSGNNNLGRKHLISPNSMSVFRYYLNFEFVTVGDKKAILTPGCGSAPPSPNRILCAVLCGKGFFPGLPLVSQKREKPFSLSHRQYAQICTNYGTRAEYVRACL